MNDAVYRVASVMLMRNPVTWRWSHARHHTDTIVVGWDAEIAVMRPPDLRRPAANVVGLFGVWHSTAAGQPDQHQRQPGAKNEVDQSLAAGAEGAETTPSEAEASTSKSIPTLFRFDDTAMRPCRRRKVDALFSTTRD